MYAVLAEESLTRLWSNTESTMDDKGSPSLHAHNHISTSSICCCKNCVISKWTHAYK